MTTTTSQTPLTNRRFRNSFFAGLALLATTATLLPATALAHPGPGTARIRVNETHSHAPQGRIRPTATRGRA